MFREFIKKTPRLLDGALGSEFLKRGLPPGKSTIAWNLENPETVINLHREYIQAGSEIITSNNFAGNIKALEKAGLSGYERDLNIEGIRLAKEAVRGSNVLTAAGLGPTGEFHRDFPSAEIEKVYSRQAEILALEEPDFFLIETMFDLREALAAVKGVSLAAPGIPIAATMTFRKTPRGFFTVMGDKAVESLNRLFDAGAEAAGANCTLMPDEMLELLKIIRGEVNAPLIIQPNAGQPELVEGEAVYRIDRNVFAEGLFKLAENGADIIGGCCGSNPKMIAVTRELINAKYV
ncbi:homocysteine S-methyltransferase family protein [bacterium]|nr:homocysteine S-methyltransferase family protein [bacterium]